jgi:kynureninase
MEKILKKLADEARRLDQEDNLARFRDEFRIPRRDDGSDLHYFCGHSLGLQPRAVESVIREELQAWSQQAVRGHFEGPLPWMKYNDELRPALAQLVGAKPREVAVMNTLTVNLHLLMVSFYRPRGTRRKILIEKHAFPSDRYAVESQIRFHGLEPSEHLVELEASAGQRLIDERDVEKFLEQNGDDIALVLWPGVQYATGQAFDLKKIAQAARLCGSNCGFDLAHAIGNVPLSLHDTGCDFAAWCHYKYLNSGPGAVAGCFVHERHHDRDDLPRFHGWWGNDIKSRFEMGPEFKPGTGADAWQLSNPPILSMAPLRASLELFQAAGMEKLRGKSTQMTAYLAEGINSQLGSLLEIITPADPQRRGCQLSIRVREGHEKGRQLFRYLETRGVLTDWREPDVIRVAPAPLYNRFEDCFQLLRHMSDWAGSIGIPGYGSAS